ncbi:MAG TPA: response regulator [Candidatus Acidoferrum sp.]
MTILLADDNLPSRELMREILEASGHIIVEAVNGRDALDLVRRNQPELVFLDLQMPVLDGFSVIRELRSDVRFRSLPVVAVTASAMLCDRERAIAAGFDSYIAKPINLGEVRKQVELLSANDARRGE